MGLPDNYHKVIETAIDAKGVWPHQLLLMRPDDSITMAALAVNKPHEVMAAVVAMMRKEKAKEVVYGMDRFCKTGQGTTLGDCIAGAHFDGTTWKPFIIEYQHEPRIVKPIDWTNGTWNRFLLWELGQWGLMPKTERP